MHKETRELINTAAGMLEQATGLNVGHLCEHLNAVLYPDGMIRIDHRDTHLVFAVQAKTRLTRTTAALAQDEQMDVPEDRLLVAPYVTPPLAEQLRGAGVFFMDAAGNAFINKPPLYVFIKGNKPPRDLQAAPTRRFLKTGGLKIVFALLNHPDMVNWPYRKIAETAGVALGTVGWIFRDLREMGFLIDIGRRRRRLVEQQTLLRRWVEAYPEQLRPKLVTDRFKADHPHWWKDVKIEQYGACWGGEVAAAELTGYLKPERVIIYAQEPPGRLVIMHKLRKAPDGDIEILKPFWKFEHKFADRGIVPPLLVYADLMATGDTRNIETAGIIYDTYLIQPDR